MPGTAADEWILLRRRPAATGVASAVAAVLSPGPAAGSETDADTSPLAPEAPDPAGIITTRQSFVGLEAAAVNLLPEEEFNLGLPFDFGLIQRMVLPPAEPDEVEEMARIQLEKILPYPIEEVGVAWQTIRQDETETVLSVQATHEERLRQFCQPLAAHSRWPLRVNFHALEVASGAAADEISVFLYRESGKMVLGICEGGKLSFAQTLDAENADDLAAQLPTVLLGAELEGVPTAFQLVRLDDRCADYLPALESTFGVPVELFRADPPLEMAAALGAPIKKDLSPPEWRVERQRMLRRARLRRNLLLAGAVYMTLLIVGLLVVAVMKFQVSRLDKLLDQANPQIAKIKAAEARWKTLTPAVDPNNSVAEMLNQVKECLPPNNAVRLTLFDQKLNTIELRGEASSQASLDFTEKIKARPQFRGYDIQPGVPTVLPSGQVQFQITATRK